MHARHRSLLEGLRVVELGVHAEHSCAVGVKETHGSQGEDDVGEEVARRSASSMLAWLACWTAKCSFERRQ